MHCTAPSFELLENSQTLLGVLLTLAVLCIFSQRTNNYILNIWISQSEKSTAALNGLLIKLKRTIKELNENEDVILLTRISTGTIKCQNPKNLRRVQMKMYNLRLIQRSDNVDFNELKLRTERLAEYNEQYEAPLYSFIYGLIVFIADEVFRVTHCIPEWGVYALYQFTILSCVFFGLIWITFFNHPVRKRKWMKKIKITGRQIKEKIGSIWLTVLLLIIILVISDGIILLSDFAKESNSTIRWVTILSLMGPITIVGAFKIWLSDSKGDYSTLQILGHLLTMFLLASAFTATIVAMREVQIFHESMVAALRAFSNLEVLRFLVVMFVMLNAVVLPLFCPLIKLSFIKRPYSKEIKERIKTAQTFSADLNREMPELCRRILCEVSKGPS